MARNGPHVTDSLRRSAADFLKQLATIDSSTGRVQRYEELYDRCVKLAFALRRSDLRNVSRIGLALKNSARYLEAIYAIPWAGGTVVPVDIRTDVNELVEIFNDATIEILMLDEAFAASLLLLSASVGSLTRMIWVGEGEAPHGCDDYEQLISTVSSPVGDTLSGGLDTFGLLYTHDTSGLFFSNFQLLLIMFCNQCI